MFYTSRITVEVDLSSIEKNIRNIRKLTNSKIIAVVKSNAYGHNLIMVSQYLQVLKIDSLAVYSYNEAKLLRENGITIPILILGNTDYSNTQKLIHYDIIQSVFSYRSAVLMSEVAKRSSERLKVHIKLDTGMGRQGIKVNENVIPTLNKIIMLQNLNVEGIYSHLSSADNEKYDTFTVSQIEKFHWVLNKLKEEGKEILDKHILNSSGIANFISMNNVDHYIRPGSLIYGLYPGKVNFTQEQAITVKSYVAFIKTVSRGTAIGYNQLYITDKKTKIAIVPIGFSDGYLKCFGNNGKVLVNGSYSRILGAINMNSLIIDITNVKGVKIFDEVVLVGKQFDKEIKISELSILSDMTTTEIACLLGQSGLDKDTIFKHSESQYRFTYSGLTNN